jgi:uncharacterized protein (DUF1800 family)
MSAFIRTSIHRWAVGLIPMAVLLLQLPAGATVTSSVPNDERAIVHALNRLAFGARPSDVAAVQRMGLGAWIEAQLRPERIPNAALEQRLTQFPTLTLDSSTIARDYVQPAREARRQRQLQAQGAPANGQPSPEMSMAPGEPPNEVLRRGRQVFAELSEAKVLRAVYSERQLEEVLVDFWFNHFNVFGRKGRTEIYVGEYERDVIRPHVLGNFRELLEATAKSPAMLFYLDNWMSSAPNAPDVQMNQRNLRPRPGQNPARRQPPNVVPRPNAAQPANNRRARGLNENYARELLELHTLGVDGGYTQQDVVEVARAFTGWTIGRQDQGDFRFAPAMHDRGAKKILGNTIAAGGGVEDGEKVLDLLARHPSTARHISFKLAQRFISDTPPETIVSRAAEVFRTTNGNLREVVRAIVTSNEFFAPEAYRAKVKTPFEFVVSALRVTNADVRTAAQAVRALVGLGMPLYLCQPPTGYDETAETWVSSGALVNRMNFALAISSGQVRGVSIAKSARGDSTRVRDEIVRNALAGDISTATLETLGKATTPEQMLALAIGSPEFQRQ